MAVSDNDIVQVTAGMELTGTGVVQNVFHVQYSGGQDVDDAEFSGDVAFALDTAYDLIDIHMNELLDFTEIGFYNITQLRPMDPEGWPTLVSGGDAFTPLPAQMAGQVDFLTGVARSRGRKYIGGLGDAISNGFSEVTALFLEDMALFGADLLADLIIGAGDGSFGHIHGLTGNFVEWVDVVVPVLLSTQRRRKSGVGV